MNMGLGAPKLLDMQVQLGHRELEMELGDLSPMTRSLGLGEWGTLA